MIVGKKAIYGCEIVIICSIIVNNYVSVKIERNNEIKKVNIDYIIFI